MNVQGFPLLVARILLALMFVLSGISKLSGLEGTAGQTLVLGDAVSWASIAVLGVFQVGLAYALLVRAIPQVPAVQASLPPRGTPACDPPIPPRTSPSPDRSSSVPPPAGATPPVAGPRCPRGRSFLPNYSHLFAASASVDAPGGQYPGLPSA